MELIPYNPKQKKLFQIDGISLKKYLETREFFDYGGTTLHEMASMLLFPESLNRLIYFLETLPPEFLMGGIFICCLGTLSVFMRFFGLAGLFVYSVLALLLSNIQVLKATSLSFFPDPIALGTVVFSSLFLVTDIVTEYYSPAKALQVTWIGFLALLFFSLILVITIGMKPLTPSPDFPEYDRFVEAHNAMKILFLPTPALFVSSLISYVLSQLNDIWIFAFLKKVTLRKYLWFRTWVSTAFASFLDSLIFSTLAWVVFAQHPVSFKTLMGTYVLGTYALRLLMSLINTPFIYVARYILPIEKERK